jgi:CHAP domain
MSEADVIERVRRIALEEARKSAAGVPGTVQTISPSGHGTNNVKYNTAYYRHEVSDPNGELFAWCVVFIWWVMRKAGVPATVFPKVASVFKQENANVRDFFKARHRFMPASSMPKKGDLVIFKSSHIGIVENVKDNTIFTVEGNASNRVRKRHYSRSSSKIDGYCRPAYELVEDDMTKDDLLDALESDRGQRALQKAVTHVLRAATGKDDASQPASIWFDEVRTKVREIRQRVH